MILEAMRKLVSNIFWDMTPCSPLSSQKMILFITTTVKTSNLTETVGDFSRVK
jgi:hypothetical protein